MVRRLRVRVWRLDDAMEVVEEVVGVGDGGWGMEDGELGIQLKRSRTSENRVGASTQSNCSSNRYIRLILTKTRIMDC